MIEFVVIFLFSCLTVVCLCCSKIVESIGFLPHRDSIFFLSDAFNADWALARDYLSCVYANDGIDVYYRFNDGAIDVSVPENCVGIFLAKNRIPDHSCLIKPPISPDPLLLQYSRDDVEFPSLLKFIEDEFGLYKVDVFDDYRNFRCDDITMHENSHFGNFIRSAKQGLLTKTSMLTKRLNISQDSLYLLPNIVLPYALSQTPVVISNLSHDHVNFIQENHIFDLFPDSVDVKHSPDGLFDNVVPINDNDVDGDAYPPEFIRDQLLSFGRHLLLRPQVKSMKLNQMTGTPCQYAEYVDINSLSSNWLQTMIRNVANSVFSDSLALDKLKTTSNIWISKLCPDEQVCCGSTVGYLHFDPFENIMVQLKGKKVWHLFPPGSFAEGHIQEAVYVNGSEYELMESTSLVHTVSSIESAAELIIETYPGDVLYLPSFWWHHVESFPIIQASELDSSFNIAVNMWLPPLFQKEFPCNCHASSGNYYHTACRLCDRSLSQNEYGSYLKSLFDKGVIHN